MIAMEKCKNDVSFTGIKNNSGQRKKNKDRQWKQQRLDVSEVGWFYFCVS